MPGLLDVGRVRRGLWRLGRPRRASLYVDAALCRRTDHRALGHSGAGDLRPAMGAAVAIICRHDLRRSGQLRKKFRRRPRMARPRLRLDHDLGVDLDRHDIPQLRRRLLSDRLCRPLDFVARLPARAALSGVITAWIGKSGTASKSKAGEKGEGSIWSKIGLAIAGPLFAAILVVGISSRARSPAARRIR